VTAQACIALLGAPNCGKTALFNRLTGGRQKVANYPGVTVERKQGELAATVSRQPRWTKRSPAMPC
jgi:ferrous iron transport protein B